MTTPEKESALVHIEIDGKSISVPAGTTILEAAWNNQIDIPVLCHEQDRTAVGVCRMCVVELEQINKDNRNVYKGKPYTAACVRALDAKEDQGLIVHTNNDQVHASRKTMLQLLMSEHPQPCVVPARKNECELETLVEKLGVPATPYSRRPRGDTRGKDTSSHAIRVDHDACILCDRCIRACADEKHLVIARQGKGHEAKIAFGLGKPMYSSGCVSCGACVIACPTSAITSNFNSPAYNHDETPSSTRKAAGYYTPGNHSPQSKELLKRGRMVEVDDLLKCQAFQHVSRKFLEHNLDCVVRRQINKGELLFTEGRPGHTAFYIEGGTVHIFIKHGTRATANGGDSGPWGTLQRTLGPGNLTGEMSCLNCYPRLATAVAATDCVVLEMLRNVLEILRNYRFRDQLELQYRERALEVLVKDKKLFEPLTEDYVKLLHDNARLVRFGPTEVIYKEGQPADAFYLISLGFVKVSQKYEGGQFVLTHLGPGSYFGEMSLLTDQKHHATCTALHHVEVIRIQGKDFHDMMKLFPSICAQLQRKVDAHVRENHEKWLNFSDHVVEQVEMGLEEAESMLVLDLDKCTRCDQCVIACEQTHDGKTRLIRDGLRADDHYLVASACRHCHDPLCMVCHWDAITRDYSDESRAVIIDANKCVGCGQCAANCPYGNIKLIDEHGKLVPLEALEDGSKRRDIEAKANSCDLCQGYKVPNCVYACPHDAAHRYSAAEFRRKRQQEGARRRN